MSGILICSSRACTADDLPVLAMYEFVITIDQEISAVWRRKLSVASILLFATRWAMVLQAIIALAPDAKTTPVRPSPSLSQRTNSWTE